MNSQLRLVSLFITLFQKRGRSKLTIQEYKTFHLMVIRCSRIRNFHYPSRKWLLLFQATGRIMSGIKKTFTYVQVNYSCESYRLGEKFNKDFDIACFMLFVMTTNTCDVQGESRELWLNFIEKMKYSQELTSFLYQSI